MKKEFPINPSPIKEGKTKSNVKKSDGKGRQAPPPVVKKEVPLFDPYTGEPNPEYEKLTGKPNPLLHSFKATDICNVPQFFEPKKTNRFLVHFPEALGIKPFLVSEIKLPVVTINKPRSIGISSLASCFGGSSINISDLEIKMIDDSIKPKIGAMYSWLTDYTMFDMKIEQLDPKNVVMNVIGLKDCHFTRIDFGSLGYGLDSDIYNYTITVTPNHISVG